MDLKPALVKELRERTGAGMMECKKALVETQGDIDAAAEWLRKAGAAKADKKASRVAAEGRVAVRSDEQTGRHVVLEVNSETDFVAKDDNFRAFVDKAAGAILAQRPANVEALLQAKVDGKTVEELRLELVTKVGENLTVRRVALVSAPTLVGSYVHTDNKKAALVAVEGGDAELARDLAMQVVASSPRYLAPSDAPAEMVAKEREIAAEQVENDPANAKKPAEIKAKIIDGRVRKAVDEFALTRQVFVKDGDLTIDKLLGKSKARIIAFERYEVGAGIEKKTGDFAAEVMEQVKAAQSKDDNKTDTPTRH